MYRGLSSTSAGVGGKVEYRARLIAYKNLLVLSSVFLLVFMSFNALQNLQTSFHSDAALGFASLCSIYIAFVISCLFLPNLMINKIGYKYTAFISIFGYILFTVAHFKPSWSTHITASVVIGFAAGPLWASKASYLTEIATNYATTVNLPTDIIISRFFCIFYLLFQFGQVIGNTISSLVLKPTEDHSNTINISTTCGAMFTPDTHLPPATQHVGNKTVTMLIGIYLGCTCLALLVLIFFLDRIIHCSGKEYEISSSLLISTFKHMKDLRMQMLVPIAVMNGLELAFLYGDFTKAFVTCSVGIEMVGLAMICYSVMCCITSIFIGVVIKWTAAYIIVAVGAHIHMALLIWLLYWDMSQSPHIILFVVAGVWGICDNIWTTQINALYGILFFDKKIEALSLFKLWQSMGYVVSFAYGNLIPVRIKIYILIGMLIVGMLFYGIVEYYRLKAKREEIRWKLLNEMEELY